MEMSNTILKTDDICYRRGLENSVLGKNTSDSYKNTSLNHNHTPIHDNSISKERELGSNPLGGPYLYSIPEKESGLNLSNQVKPKNPNLDKNTDKKRAKPCDRDLSQKLDPKHILSNQVKPMDQTFADNLKPRLAKPGRRDTSQKTNPKLTLRNQVIPKETALADNLKTRRAKPRRRDTSQKTDSKLTLSNRAKPKKPTLADIPTPSSSQGMNSGRILSNQNTTMSLSTVDVEKNRLAKPSRRATSKNSRNCIDSFN